MSATAGPVYQTEEIRAAVLGKDEHPAKYEEMLRACKAGLTSGDATTVFSWLDNILNCVSCFSRSSHHVIDLVLERDFWVFPNQDSRDKLMELLTAMASSCTLYAQGIMAYLVPYLRRPLPDVVPEHRQALEANRQQLDLQVLGAISEILTNSPNEVQNCARVLSSNVPHQSLPVYVHDKFWHNTIDLALAHTELIPRVLYDAVVIIIKMDIDHNAITAANRRSPRAHEANGSPTSASTASANDSWIKESSTPFSATDAKGFCHRAASRAQRWRRSS